MNFLRPYSVDNDVNRNLNTEDGFLVSRRRNLLRDVVMKYASDFDITDDGDDFYVETLYDNDFGNGLSKPTKNKKGSSAPVDKKRNTENDEFRQHKHDVIQARK